MVENSLLNEFLSKNNNDLSQAITDTFDMHLADDDDTEITKIKDILDEILKDRIDALD